jgi:hypothetical protein
MMSSIGQSASLSKQLPAGKRRIILHLQACLTLVALKNQGVTNLAPKLACHPSHTHSVRKTT